MLTKFTLVRAPVCASVAETPCVGGFIFRVVDVEFSSTNPLSQLLNHICLGLGHSASPQHQYPLVSPVARTSETVS